MIKIAEKYKKTDPKSSNAIVELGKKGQLMAQAMKTGNQAAITTSLNNFNEYFLRHVDNKRGRLGPLSLISRRDGIKVKVLTNRSAQLAALFSTGYIHGQGNLKRYHSNVDKDNALGATKTASRVHGNSFQTEQCGRKLKCN